MNVWSNAGTYIAGNVKDPSFMDVRPGLAYSITLVNTTATDATGDVTIQTAPPSDADPCVPGAWSDLMVEPWCGDPNGVTSAAKVTFAVGSELKAGAQCQISAPCPEAFIKVVSTLPAGVSAIGVVTRLRQQGGGAMAGMAA